MDITLATVMAELKEKGSEKTRKTYARHGMPTDRIFGVSIADLKPIAKSIKGQMNLASELYDTGFVDAMYLAGMIADGAQMTEKQLNAWVEGAAGLPMIAENTVPWVAVENPKSRELALKWIKSKKEHIASCGWCTYSGIVAIEPDDSLDLGEIEELLNTIVKEIKTAPNRVRYSMNGFVIAVGAYVKPLSKRAMKAASQIGAITVDMGDTSCNVPLATAGIEKVQDAGRVGRKRKSIRG